ncbi:MULTISPECIES: tRNA pseudouridine(55) synthase TruB [Petrotoga]|uniref:tRNA pseudouridine synthase B n=4 Tax=Petrotoga TaxID=28236 RepID=A0A4R8EX59_9BACT|nr:MULTISPECIES: tRNA pseudouridine(55) synthase TruB [Petrotoga]PNR95445.1 tRNA pseudouridine synthase B [Petrotoga olearia DSM 13574]POZ88040.1 tRNA pseudouridine synthase B [Petrotoga sibirica DSM 13575]RMA72643.1 tRNA pseudouridine synthase B [Petrotoga olearia]TDX17139.1 tRNA pseudouridine synthase B [Petrotoga sibirica]
MKSGFLVINKPKGITSHDVVSIIRKKFGIKKVGHAGTLDPFATGVLVVGINKATRLLEFFQNEKKTYYVKAELGIITDTFDIEGKIQERNEVSQQQISNLKNTCFSFVGEYLQVPPAYSAKKYNGKKLYEYAREGKIINLPPKKVNIYQIANFSQEGREFSFYVEVSSGTYIRSLIMDIGYALGCGAVTKELCRIKSGKFELKDSILLEEASLGKILKMDEALDLPYVKINNGQQAIKGQQIYKDNIIEFSNFNKNDYVKIYDEKQSFLGIGRAEKKSTFLKTLLKEEERNDRIVKIYKILYEVT